MNLARKRRAAASAPAPQQGDQGMDDQGSDEQATDQPQSIQDDPKAMSLIHQLEQMGYTADDVASVMSADEDQDQDQGNDDMGDAATAAAPLQLPGLSR